MPTILPSAKLWWVPRRRFLLGALDIESAIDMWTIDHGLVGLLYEKW